MSSDNHGMRRGDNPSQLPNYDQTSQPHGRTSAERLQYYQRFSSPPEYSHAESSRQADIQQQGQQSTTLPEGALPTYTDTNTPDQPFPDRPSFAAKLTGTQIKLSEEHILDTKGLADTNTSIRLNTCYKLLKRASVIKIWIEQHKSALTDDKYKEFKELRKDLKDAKSTFNLRDDQYRFSAANHNEVRDAIINYKNKLMPILKLAHDMHREFNGLPPLT